MNHGLIAFIQIIPPILSPSLSSQNTEQMSCTCYNFCLYAYLNDHFRKQFKEVLPCFKLPFFKRARNEDTNQTTAPTAANKQKPSVGQLNATSVLPLTSVSKEPTRTGKLTASACIIHALTKQVTIRLIVGQVLVSVVLLTPLDSPCWSCKVDF